MHVHVHVAFMVHVHACVRHVCMCMACARHVPVHVHVSSGKVSPTDTSSAQRHDNCTAVNGHCYSNYVVLGADISDGLEVAFAGHNHSIFSLDGLHMECSTVGV